MAYAIRSHCWWWSPGRLVWRSSASQLWAARSRNSKKLGLAITVIQGAVVAGLFQTLPAPGSRLPQLYCYLANVLTGYIVTAMLEEEPGNPDALSKGGKRTISPVRAWGGELITES